MSSTTTALFQLLIALAFISIPLVRARYGARAQSAVENELGRQGVRTTVMAENGMRLDAGGHETWAPLGIALTMTSLAALNLFGNSWGETLSWYLQPVVLLINCVILYSNLTATASVAAAFARSDDSELRRIDVKAMLTAAEQGFPRWVMPYLQNIRHTVVFAGSLAVLALLATS
ncbi:hypothetical protein [Streptomyces purpureus]|uniref:Uncharacterized protein n=1 Tax=Streptomyces purpureus TaxID=1951 RepID=A0A918LV41_9ACTN|nr:hypothetical protein [Streptomyces purpureus]GGT53926.1 hypothetical protein GCM10014713_54760 [Streptomyces purpureus]